MRNNFTYEWLDFDIIVTFFGEINYIDIMEANNVIFGDIRFDRMKYQIFDYSKIEGIDLKEDISEIISKLDLAANVWNNRVKVATVTPDNRLRDLISVYNKKMERSKWKTKTFETMEEALKWCTEK